MKEKIIFRKGTKDWVAFDMNNDILGCGETLNDLKDKFEGDYDFDIDKTFDPLVVNFLKYYKMDNKGEFDNSKKETND